MKTTRFMRKCRGNNGDLLLLNTLNGNLTVVSKEKSKTYENLLDDPDQEIDEKAKNFLIEREYIVDNDTNEASRAELAYLEAAHSTHCLLLTILPTEDCNFRCQYCYEEHNKGRMKDCVCEGIKNYIIKNLHKYDMLQVNWFGGEPLEALDIIENLSEFFIKICNEQKKPFRASITTNGYLLTSDIFKLLYRLHIVDYQITLDGLRESHNLSRPYIDGGGTYDVIIDNLRNIRDNIRTQNINITIRTNITKNVIQNIEDHIQLLADEFGDDKRFGVIFKIAWSNERDTEFNRRQLLETGELHSVLDLCMSKKLRFKMNREQICSIAGICYAAHSNAYVIGADGVIYKCTVEYKKDINQIGQIDKFGNMNIDKNKLAYWVTRPSFKGEFEKCSTCYFQPACMGVYCPLNRFDENNNHKCAGMKDYVDEYMALCSRYDEMVERV